MPFLKYIFLCCLFFYGCNDITKRFVEETIKEGHKSDSLKESREEFPISKEHFEVLEKKAAGSDSLFLVRSFFISKKKYSECWYKNQVLHGVAKFYYPNGKLSHTLFYKDDLLTDLIESYFPDGTPRADSKLKNGTGNLKLYHPITFKLYVECSLKNAHREGKYISYYANGSIHEDYDFVKDSVVGDFTIKYKSGLVKSQRRALNDKLTYSYFYPNGKPEKLQVWNKGLFVNSKEFDENGNIKEQIWPVDEGLKSVKSFYGSKNQLLSRGNYINEKKQGAYEYYYEDGNKKATEFYNMDELESETRWHENGNLSQVAKYKGGEYDGLYLEYYPNGKKRKEQTYVKGVKEGKYISYFDNGNKYNECVFVEGKPKGQVKVYSREGKFEGNREY